MTVFSRNNFYNTAGLKRFQNPTCLLQGRGASALVGELVDPARPGAWVVDHAFAGNPALEEWSGQRKDNPCFVVAAEPSTDFVDACLRTLPSGLEWIVAIGGGSSIDTAKALVCHGLFGEYRRVGYGLLRNSGDPLLRPPRLVAVPTTAGTGSETSRYFLVSDATTHQKLVSRTWLACPEFALLDPDFLSEAPAAVVIAGAFDSFVHHWETFLCRQESAPLTQMLSVEGLGLITSSLQGALRHDQSCLEALQRASALGGIALSNVRTGFMHTAGEVLAASTRLSHPLTLMVFFPAVLASYQQAINPRAGRLLAAASGAQDKPGGIPEIIEWWTGYFAQAGLLKKIAAELSTLPADTGSRIVEAVMSDKVLVEKEHPVPLDRMAVESIVHRALAFGNAP